MVSNMTVHPFRIRTGTPDDQAAAYHVCVKTGDHGGDGEPFYRDDPAALGRIFVGPYLAFEPELSLILEDDQGVCGYAFGALDSRRFYLRYELEWRPRLCSVSISYRRSCDLVSYKPSILVSSSQTTSARNPTRYIFSHAYRSPFEPAVRMDARDGRSLWVTPSTRFPRCTPWSQPATYQLRHSTVLWAFTT